ncbi:MAG: glycosyltransferase [Ardenticatenaceae bacterium]|nr:glycosyltransferase [Ardenticatenaceae bacterium]
MKIMQITQSYPPMISGASLIVAELAKGLAQAGHEVLVVAASERPEGYGQQDGRLRIERLPSWHNPVRVGQRFMVWPQRPLMKLAQSFQPDVIHIHEPLALSVCGLKAAKTMNVPAVLTLHQLPWFVTKYTRWLNFEWLLWAYGRHALKQYAAHIVPMAQIAGVVQQYTGCPSCVIPHGLDLARFQTDDETGGEAASLRHKYGLPANKPVMLHVGRLDVDKNVQYVLQAVAQVTAVVEAELLIVGDGRQRQALEKLAEVLGIAEHCHFTGFVAPEGDLSGVYHLADLFVTASEIETLGIVILEAMASACPVVAVNATCMSELVHDQHGGFLVNPQDIEGLAAKMIWLLQNPEAARQMGQYGQAISHQYSLEMMVKEHLELYQVVQEARAPLPVASSAVTPTHVQHREAK